MKKKHFILIGAGIAMIIFSNIYLGKVKSDTNCSLSDLTNIAQAGYEYVRPTAQNPDGTFCCKNTQYTACTASELCD